METSEKSSVISAAASEPWRMPEPTNLIFPKWQRELFKTILDKAQQEMLGCGLAKRTDHQHFYSNSME